uniref:Uncharacterized protein n=1 Tax=Ascaris lumbricoides TaxID=6252 RepID=A0A0M3I5A9_ASCLU
MFTFRATKVADEVGGTESVNSAVLDSWGECDVTIVCHMLWFLELLGQLLKPKFSTSGKCKFLRQPSKGETYVWIGFKARLADQRSVEDTGA